MTDKKMILNFLQERFGLDLNSRQTTSPDGQQFLIHSNDVAQGEGFVFEINQKWIYIEAKFSLETFASDLLQNIKNHTPQQKAVFKFFIKITHRERLNDVKKSKKYKHYCIEH